MASWVSTSMVLTLLGFCVSVLFIVFVCSRLACALVRRHRLRRNRRSRFPDLADAAAGGFLAIHVDRLGHTTAATSTGLDPAAVAAFPTRAFSAASAAAAAGGSSASSDAAPQCIVCLAEYEDNDPLRILPYCGHDFHVACIDMWLKQHSTCPVCRISLCDLPASTYAAPPPPSSVIIPPYSPEASRSDPCNCLFVSAGHSSRTSEVLRNEPDQASQIVYPPSFDGGINLPSSEVNPPGENNNQTVKKHVESPQIHDKS